MIEVVIAEHDIIKFPAQNSEYRILCNLSDMVSVCQMNVPTLEIMAFGTDDIADRVEKGTMEIVHDQPPVLDFSKFSESEIEKFKLRKQLMDDLEREYGPTFFDLSSKKPKPIIDKYLSMRDAEGHAYFSRTNIWRIIRLYLQSGKQDYALIDQRKFSSHESCDWKTTPGKKAEDGNVAKLLTEEDFENFEKYMNRYLRSEVSTQMNAYLNMVSDCYSVRAKSLDSNGNVIYKKIFKPADQTPTYRQFNWYVRTHTTKKKREEAKMTKRVVRNNARVFTGTVMDDVKGPGYMCEVDAQEMDIALVSEEYSEIPVGRPILYIIIDVMSEMILGVSLAMDNNSVVGLTNVLLNLVEDKTALFKTYCNTEIQFAEGMTMDDVWPTGYRPSILKFDNGSDFISYDISRILKELNIVPRILPAATGSLKPLVEQFFSGIKKDLDDLLEHKGLIRNVYGSKHHEEACLTYSDAMAIVLNHVVAHNCHVIQSYVKSADMKRKKIQASPVNLWKYGMDTMKQPVKFSSRDQVIYSIMQPEKSVSLNNQGIHFQGLVYFNASDSALQEMAFDTGRKRIRFEARSDPRDMGHLYYLRDGKLMCASVPERDFRMKSFIGVSRKQFDELNRIDRETRKQGDILNREVRIAKRDKNKAIIDAAAKEHPGMKDASGIRENRAEEKAMISAAHSVAERFDMHSGETMINGEGTNKAALDFASPNGNAASTAQPADLIQTATTDSGNGSGINENNVNGQSIDEIKRQMMEVTQNMMDDDDDE